LFLYAGIEKEEYHQLRPRIREENRVLLELFSELGGVMLFLLFIMSILSRGFATVNSTTYLVSGFVMVAILLCVRFVVPQHPAFVMVLVYVFEIVLYVFGIRISMLHADKPAVSAVAFLLVSPLLFYDRPVRLSALISAVTAVFCVMVVRLKQPDIAKLDIWNMVTFAIVAIVTTIFIMTIKMRALRQSRQIEYLSQTDLLTGVKNRNHYENQLQRYPEFCSSNLICVYGDVNGLHETNNRKGHQAGDKMLREVAERMQQAFGPEHTYRIGGDEFVAFRADGQLETTLSEVDRMGQELSRHGYHVSFGVAAQEKEQGTINMRELVREAENKMYSAKREFYREPEHNRRSR